MAFSGSAPSMKTVQSTTQWYCNRFANLGWGLTTSWMRVGDFHSFWSSRVTTKYVTNQSSLRTFSQPGCVVMLVDATTGEPYHAIIITAKTASEFLYCGHSYDRLDQAVSSIKDDENNYYIYNFSS